MSIKKSIFKISNGSGWDEHHFETDSGQVAHTTEDGEQTTVEEELNSLNRNTEILMSDDPNVDGRAIRAYSNPTNLKYGCYTEGIYPYAGYTVGAPNDWSGILLSSGVSQGNEIHHLKYAFTRDGKIYYMVQKSGTGEVMQDWEQIAPAQ